VTGLEFKLKATVAREKAECRIQLFPRLRLRPKSKSRTLTWKKNRGSMRDILQQICRPDGSSDQRNKRMQQFQEDRAVAAEHEAAAPQTMATQS